MYEFRLLKMLFEKNLLFVLIFFKMLQRNLEEKNFEICFEPESHMFLSLMLKKFKEEVWI
jgi:hypothetical protein